MNGDSTKPGTCPGSPAGKRKPVPTPRSTLRKPPSSEEKERQKKIIVNNGMDSQVSWTFWNPILDQRACTKLFPCSLLGSNFWWIRFARWHCAAQWQNRWRGRWRHFSCIGKNPWCRQSKELEFCRLKSALFDTWSKVRPERGIQSQHLLRTQSWTHDVRTKTELRRKIANQSSNFAAQRPKQRWRKQRCVSGRKWGHWRHFFVLAH